MNNDILTVHKTCQKIWKGIYNPYSAYPDVSIGHVLEVMTQLLAEQLGPGLDDLERWALARLMVCPTAAGALEWTWVSSRVDDALLGAEYEDQKRTEEQRFQKAIQSLIAKGLLREETIEKGAGIPKLFFVEQTLGPVGD